MPTHLDAEELTRRLIRSERQILALKSVLKGLCLLLLNLLKNREQPSQQLKTMLETLETITPPKQ